MDDYDSLLNKHTSFSNIGSKLKFFFSHYPLGAAIQDSVLKAHNSQFVPSEIDSFVDILAGEDFLEEEIRDFCPVHDNELDSLKYCDLCHSKILEKNTKKEVVFIVRKLIQADKKWFEDFENIPSILKPLSKKVLLGIPRFIYSMQTVPPKYLLENDFKEELFRDEFLRSTSFMFDTTGESKRGAGRSDIIISVEEGTLKERVIGEFKVWGRNNHEEVIDQLLGYMSNFEDFGFVFMVNKNKTSIADQYKQIIQASKDYLPNTMREQPLLKLKDVFKHYSSQHNLNGRIRHIYHFIFDLEPWL